MTAGKKIFFLTVPLLLGAFTASLFFQGLTDPWFAPAILAILAFGGIVLYSLSLTEKTVPWSTTAALVLAWWLLLAASQIWAAIPFNSIVFFFIFSFVPFLFFTFLMMPDSWPRIHFYALAGAVVSMAIVAGAQFFIWPEIYGPRVRLLFHNPNSLGGLFVLVLLPAIGLFFAEKNPRRRILWFIAAIAVFTGLLTTQSRGAILGGVLALMPLLAAARHKDGFARNFLLLAGTAALAFFVFKLSGGDRLGSQLKALAAADDANSIDLRLALWAGTWALIKQSPWLGSGLGTFYLLYPPFRSPLDQSSGLWAHNDPLQFWAELGILGPVLFYALLVAVLFRTIRAWRKTDDPLRLMIPFSGLLAVVSHTHVTFHLYQPSILILTGLLLAWWYRETEAVLPSSRKVFKISPAVFIFTGIGFLMFSAMWVGRAGMGVYLAGQAREELKSGNIENFAQTVDRLYGTAPASYYQTYLLLAEFHSTMVRLPQIPITPRQRQEHVDTAFSMLETGERLNPAEPMLKHSRANLLKALGRREDARAVWQGALAQNPQHFESRMALAQLLMEDGRREDALKLLEDGLVWPYMKDPTEYYLTTAQARLAAGDLQGHLELMDWIKKRFARGRGASSED